MGWVLEASDWDLTELGREDVNSLAALTGSNSLGGQNNGGGFPVDLGLGRLGDLAVGTVEKLKEPRGLSMASSPSGLSNRTRGLNGNQHPSCLVDGCTSDLRNCREYHRRHRVCERHSKTPVVIVGGREQRFCQQCSRFHSLGEFDEVKRSCRKRLDGHNRRRRKLQPESLYMGSRSFLSNHQGARLLQFGGPQAYGTTTGGSSLTWPSIDKHHQEFHVIVQQSVPSNTFSFSYSGRNKQFPFFLANPEIGNQTSPEVSASRGLLNNNTSPESGSGDLNRLPGKLTHLVESKRALSLLSTHPTQTPGTSLRHLGQQNVYHLNQTPGTGLQFNGLAQYSHSQGMEKPVDAVLATNASNTYNNSNEMYHVGPDEMLENGASQLLSFSWN